MEISEMEATFRTATDPTPLLPPPQLANPRFNVNVGSGYCVMTFLHRLALGACRHTRGGWM